MIRNFKTIVLLILGIFVFQSNAWSQSIQPPWFDLNWDITSDYGPRAEYSFFHKGIDYGATEGTDIEAIEGGQIVNLYYEVGGAGWHIAVTSTQNNRWAYFHMFSEDGSSISSKWEARFVTLENPNDGSSVDSYVIIEWLTDQKAKKVLSEYIQRGYYVYDTDCINYIKDENGLPIETKGSVEANEPVGPVGNSGVGRTHLHVGLNLYGRDNPLYHLIHKPSPTEPERDFQFSLEYPTSGIIDNNTDNHFTVKINSEDAYDLDKVEMFLENSSDTVITSIRFSYGGKPSEGKENIGDAASNGTTTGVVPISNGIDNFVWEYQKI